MLGTSSGAGKSLVASAIIRALHKRGIDVAPFKPINISLNAGVGEGGEMAYAQIVQARAAGLEPEACMNPVLVKPEENGMHVIIRGKHALTSSFNSLNSRNVQERLFDEAMNCFIKLEKEHDLIVIEGTGSPAEVNMPNTLGMSFIRSVKAKFILVSDVYRGGSFASVLGTLDVIGKDGFIGAVLNRMAGDAKYIENAFQIMRFKYGINILGVLPIYDLTLPWEDSSDMPKPKNGSVKFLVITAHYMSNFTDVYPLYLVDDTGVSFMPYYVDGFDAVIIPGSKVTVADVIQLKREGVDEDLRAAASGGKLVMGLCGGFQALGTKIIDYVESRAGEVDGLGLLPNKTLMEGQKVVSRSSGYVIAGPGAGVHVSGYEIHYGKTESINPHLIINKRNGSEVTAPDGEVQGNVIGTYLHGILENDSYLLSLINMLRAKKGLQPLNLPVPLSYEPALDLLANELEKRINVDKILSALKA